MIFSLKITVQTWTFGGKEARVKFLLGGAVPPEKVGCRKESYFLEFMHVDVAKDLLLLLLLLLLREFKVQTDHLIEHNKADILLLNEDENTCITINVALSIRHQNIERIWNSRLVQVIAIVTDLFTDTVAIFNHLDLRSIIGCPGGMSTIR